MANVCSCCKRFRSQRDRRNPHWGNCSPMFMIPFLPTFVSKWNCCVRDDQEPSWWLPTVCASLTYLGTVAGRKVECSPHCFCICMYLVQLCALTSTSSVYEPSIGYICMPVEKFGSVREGKSKCGRYSNEFWRIIAHLVINFYFGPSIEFLFWTLVSTWSCTV